MSPQRLNINELCAARPAKVYSLGKQMEQIVVVDRDMSTFFDSVDRIYDNATEENYPGCRLLPESFNLSGRERCPRQQTSQDSAK